MSRRGVFFAIATGTAFVLAGHSPVAADANRLRRARPWAKVVAPSTGPARAIGRYKAGCLQGGRRLPLDGPGYFVVRPQRKRNYGHPNLVAFIKKLGREVDEAGLGRLPISDMGQARGGPTPSGHASHQSGLDVDIWFGRVPRSLRHRRLTRAQRNTIQPMEVVSARAKGPTKHWSSRVLKVLELAAKDDRVARIFINPRIKVQACKLTRGDRSWLRKLRPWYGHAAHFHVRLNCPKSSPACRPQAAPPKGDGCNALGWWFNKKAQQARRKNHKKYRKHVRTMPTLPEQCKKVLHRKRKR